MDSFPQPSPNTPPPAAPTPTPAPMGNEPVTPASAGPFGSGAGSSVSALGIPDLTKRMMGSGGGGSSLGGGGGSPIMMILVIIFGLGALVFGVMAVVANGQAQTATKNLNTKVSAAVGAAQAKQKDDDTKANELANESPFRAYVAPVSDGSFVISFPKDWSSWVDQETSGTQVNLFLNPDFVRRTGGVDELAATRVQLIERSSDQYMQQFSSNVKNGKLKQTDTTVSGQHAIDLNGTFGDKRTSRTVVVPVRDKVIVFINENSKYAAEFGEILAQAKINP